MKKERHTSIIKGKPQRLQEYGVGIFSILETKSSLKKSAEEKFNQSKRKVGNNRNAIIWW